MAVLRRKHHAEGERSNARTARRSGQWLITHRRLQDVGLGRQCDGLLGRDVDVLAPTRPRTFVKRDQSRSGGLRARV